MSLLAFLVKAKRGKEAVVREERESQRDLCVSQLGGLDSVKVAEWVAP